MREYPLHEGMATSNGKLFSNNITVDYYQLYHPIEPGYYKEGAFGIRIENILIVQKDAIQGFYSFLNVTVVPYERKLINLDMLTDAEIDFIDAYHQRVRNASFVWNLRCLKIYMHKCLHEPLYKPKY